MPLRKGKKNVGANISELHKGPQYKRTKAKFGKKVANKQAVAAGMHGAGMTMGKKSPMAMRCERGMESYAKSRKK